MKNHLHSLLFLFIVICPGCDDDSSRVNVTTENVDVTIQSGDTYTHDFGVLGIESSVAIKKQATHAEISSLQGRDHQDHTKFTYKAQPGFSGTDEVQIQFCHSAGSGKCDSMHITKLRFTVNN